VIQYLSVSQVIDLHTALATAFGGPLSVRDRGGLESAVARPFSINVTYVLQPDTDVLEYFCNENERDRVHIANAK
jgi:hypothetical protein